MTLSKTYWKPSHNPSLFEWFFSLTQISEIIAFVADQAKSMQKWYFLISNPNLKKNWNNIFMKTQTSLNR